MQHVKCQRGVWITLTFEVVEASKTLLENWVIIDKISAMEETGWVRWWSHAGNLSCLLLFDCRSLRTQFFLNLWLFMKIERKFQYFFVYSNIYFDLREVLYKTQLGHLVVWKWWGRSLVIVQCYFLYRYFDDKILVVNSLCVFYVKR